MKAFHFTLEAVRTLRQRQEQTCMEQYAQALLARQQATDRLAAVQQEIAACYEGLRVKLTAGCPAIEAAQAHDYHRVLGRRRDECTAQLGACERRVNATLQAMLAARQQREIVDKYFDKQKIRHQRDVARDEQKMLDDLAGRRGNSILTWNPTEMPV